MNVYICETWKNNKSVKIKMGKKRRRQFSVQTNDFLGSLSHIGRVEAHNGLSFPTAQCAFFAHLYILYIVPQHTPIVKHFCYYIPRRFAFFFVSFD